jgi:hypothetical protein
MSEGDTWPHFVADFRSKELANSVNDSRGYQYRPLDPTISEIRLLRLEPGEEGADIHCSLTHVLLDDKPEYEALSYMWGDATLSQPILLAENPHFVTENLEIALQHIRRKDEARILWIDALCINQKDLKERGEQVQKMKLIFDTASVILAWLGKAEDNSDEAFDLLLEMSEAIAKLDNIRYITPFNLEAVGFHTDEKDWGPVLKLLDRPYWTRCWVIQELIRSGFMLTHGDSVVHIGCGYRWSSKRLVKWFALLVMNKSNFMTGSHVFEPLSSMFRNGRSPSAIHFNNVIGECDPQGEPTDLGQLLVWSGSFHATDRRDKVFALLSLCGEKDQQIVADYTKTTQDVLREVFTHVTTTNSNLDILPRDTVRSKTIPDAPSWSFELDYNMTEPLWLGHLTSLRAASSVPPEFRFTENGAKLHLQGLFIGTVQTVDIPFDDTLPPASTEENPDPTWALLESIAEMFKNFISVTESLQLNVKDQEIIWRTLILDGDFSQDPDNPIVPAPDTFKKMGGYAFTRDMSTQYHHMPSDFEPDLPEPERYLKFVAPFTQSMGLVLESRTVFVTTEGMIGIGPIGMEPKDIVCILFGGKFCYILRLSGDDYRYIGNAYLHGVSRGELMEPETTAKYVEREFAIV